ncbi:penicillin-binding protein 1A [Aliikangiella maris]|uniref:PBP1A family penicillin-binding protein n=2 Tax=Aliikangiella maris TaxID=3162458 RepID=A0ABV3MSJ6_9GAMM
MTEYLKILKEKYLFSVLLLKHRTNKDILCRHTLDATLYTTVHMKLLSKLTPKIVYFVTLFTLLAAMGFIGLYLAVGPGLPQVESIRQIQLQTPMKIYSSDHQLIAEFGDKRRIPITLDQVPKDFINALLATEDQRFYQHSGVDFWGVMRAFANLILTQRKAQGASTITMMVARNYYLSREKRFSRKFTEMFLAWKIESELSKNEILELFLNKIPFGHRAYGLGAASQVYYGTTLNNLSLAQLATLAGIPKGQSAYNPISNPDKAKSRRTHVLGRMLTEQYITQLQYNEAVNEPIETSKHGARATVYAPYVAEMARQEVIDRYGKNIAYNDGLKIYTTLNSELQHFARQALIEGLEEYDRRHGYRGPEQQYAITPETSIEQMQSWLQDLPSVADLIPALVTQLEEDKAIILLANGLLKSISLQSMKWARKYVDENHRGPRIKTIDQVAAVGDIIRVRVKLNNIDNRSDATEQSTDTNQPTEEYLLAQIPQVSGALVSLVPKTGAIESLVGGYDFTLNQYNMVTQARRQPGSNIKPFVYSAAFNKDYTPASMINDMPIVEADITAENFWRPKNDGDKYLGPISLRTALRRSKNTVSARLIREIGPSYTKGYLEKIGFPGEHMEPYLSLALGSAAFTPLEVVTGYATLANGGYRIKPWFIQRIEDSNGQIIFEEQPLQVCRECELILANQQSDTQLNQQQQTLSTDNEIAQTHDIEVLTTPVSEDYAQRDNFANLPVLPIPEKLMAPRVIEARNHYLVDNILKDVIHRGTGYPTLARTKSPLLKRNDLAGKTGTTNDAKDAWFSGYNLNHVTTAWVGFSDHAKKLGAREFGGIAALPIWQKFIEKAVDGKPQLNHPMPPGIVSIRIDPKNGLLATNLTESPIFELFRTENAPTEYSEKPIEDIFNKDQEIVKDTNIF